MAQRPGALIVTGDFVPSASAVFAGEVSTSMAISDSKKRVGFNTPLPRLIGHKLDRATRRRIVVADPGFIRFLLLQGVQSVPKCVDVNASAAPQHGGDNPNYTAEHLERVSLEFAVAWRFLHPFLSNAEVKTYLESAWPSFVSDMKDAFIALVVDGPFPSAMSGHRGRRHHDSYFGK